MGGSNRRQDTILLVGHGNGLVGALSHRFESAGHSSRAVASYVEALIAVRERSPDLVLLVSDDPLGSGCIDACRRIREISKTPLLALCPNVSSSHVAEMLINGADDHLHNDVNLEEFDARVQALLRRNQLSTYFDAAEITAGPLRLICQQAACAVNGDHVKLTPREFKLLKALALQPDTILNREQLIEQVWGSPYYASAENLRKLVQRLRLSLAEIIDLPDLIVSAHGYGYYLDTGTNRHGAD